jgi:hypothetical protein
VPGDYNNSWTAAPTLDQHYAGYVQDRWAPNNRLTITAGARIDYQDLGYGDATRKPEICDATTSLQTGDGGRIFPCSSSIAKASYFKNTDIAARVGFSYNLDGVGKTVLKAFYGRYYNNLADGFSAANPGGQRYVDYNFNDLNGNLKYDGVQELGTFRTRIGGADAPVDPNTRTPHTDEVSATVERQFWGESSIRGTYVRKMQRDYVPFYFTPIVTAWLGQLTVPKTATVAGKTYNLVDVPDALADETGTEYTNYPGGEFNYDTIEVAFTARRAEVVRLRQLGLDQPALDRSNRRRTGAQYQSERRQPTEDDDVPRAAVRPLYIQGRLRSGRELSVPERLPVRAVLSRRGSGVQRLQLPLLVLHAEPRPEPVGECQPVEHPHRQIVPDRRPRQGDADARCVQHPERRSSDQLQPLGHVAEDGDRGAGSARVPDGIPV